MKTPGSEVSWPRRVRTPADAVQFIDAVGYCVLFPVKRVPLPSLYYACARRNADIAKSWDRYCQLIWNWKDELPRKNKAFYAKYFKQRGTFISLKLLPYFLAMEQAPKAPGDYEHFYAAGRISHDARTLWQALDEHGPLATLELRHACKMDTQAGNKRFKKAMLELQCQLVVVHFGAEQETAAWASNRFEMVTRAFPQETRASRRITPERARAFIAAKYLDWHPEATTQTVARLFGWTRAETGRAMRLN